MIGGKLHSSLSSECNTVEFMDRDMQGYILAEGVVAMLPLQHEHVTAAEVSAGDADLMRP